MKEILFRAKAINRDSGYHRTLYKNGDWVYGLVTKLYNPQFENLPMEMTDVNGISVIEVDYETVGQYIGINDVNNYKIFEGDIVNILTENEEIGVIKYEDGCYIVEADSFCVNFYDNINGNEVEIIGNIYNNPELVKE